MTRRRHIVFVNEFYHPDLCATAAVLSDRLPRLVRLLPDFEFTVIAGNRAWDDPRRMYAAHDEFEGVRIVRVDRPAVGSRGLIRRGMGFITFGRNALRAAGSLGPIDLVIGTTAPPQGGGLARRMARRARCPFIYTVWDLYPDLVASLGKLSERSPVFRLWRWLDVRAMRDAARVVCISSSITQRIIRTRNPAADRIITIHDGFDPARLGRAADQTREEVSFQHRYNPEGRTVIQYAGNMGLSHPFETILSACDRLSRDPSLLFQFIGDGPRRGQIASRLPANGVLIDYQPAERLGEMLDTADICLISQHEAMFDQALPYKIYASLASSRPILFVGGAESETAVWLRESGAGLVVRHGDVVGLVSAMERLRDDATLRARMGRAGRQLLTERLHAEQAAEKWAGLIHEVVS